MPEKEVLEKYCKELYSNQIPKDVEKSIDTLARLNIYREHAFSQLLCERYLRKLVIK